MNKKGILYVLGIFLLMITSCKKESDELLNSNVLIPVNTGNVWTYRSTRFSGLTAKIDTVESRIGSKVVIDGNEGFIINNTLRPFNATYFGINNSEGNLISFGGFSDVDTLVVPSVQFRIDAETGEQWDFHDVIFSYDDGTLEEKIIKVTCLSIDTLITTPMGDFTCSGFEQSPNSGEDLFNYFISENVGIVKVEHYELDRLFSNDELIDFKLIK